MALELTTPTPKEGRAHIKANGAKGKPCPKCQKPLLTYHCWTGRTPVELCKSEGKPEEMGAMFQLWLHADDTTTCSEVIPFRFTEPLDFDESQW